MEKQYSIPDLLREMSSLSLKRRIARLQIEKEVTRAVCNKELMYVYTTGPVDPESYKEYIEIYTEIYSDFKTDGFKLFLSYPEKGSDGMFRLIFDLRGCYKDVDLHNKNGEEEEFDLVDFYDSL